MSRRRGLWIKAALSVFIVYHMFCVLLAPNSQTYLGGRAKFLVNPYVSFFELASQWGFFAPDPGPPPVFVEYEAVADGGEPIATGSWPEKKDPFFIRERQNRRIAVARFLMAGEGRIEKTFGPYYCRQYPKARSVRLWRTVQGMANLHDVASGKRTIDDTKALERKWITQYLCDGGAVR